MIYNCTVERFCSIQRKLRSQFFGNQSFWMQFFANSSESSKVFIFAWFTIIHSIAFVLFKDNQAPGFFYMNFCKWITRQHLRCHHGNIFQNFDELFAGTSCIWLKQKNYLDYMSWFQVLCYTECTKKLAILGLNGHWLVILHKISYNLAIKSRNNHSYIIL